MNQKKLKARVLNIVQYETNPKTGESLHFDENNILNAVARKSVKRYGYIRHDKDVYDAKDVAKHLERLKAEYDELKNPNCTEADYIKMHQYIFEGNAKPPHWHLVIDAPNKIDVDMVARDLGIPMNCIDLPKGHGAFLDCIAYLDHTDENSIKSGKTLYCQNEVIANFDWIKEVQHRKESKEKYGRVLSEKEQMFFDVTFNGMTLRECEKANPFLYIEHLDKLTKLRLDYIKRQKPPTNRINYYITGKGGSGKDLMSRALARALFPQYEDDDDIFFVVGAANATFEGYDGQPVLIWSDRRAAGLIKVLGGRENVFNVFETHPTKQRQNVKYGSINLCNVVNIVNGQETYTEFLDGLAGEYKDREGQKHKAEDKGQSYRRFPFIIPLHDTDFDLLINKGYYYNDRSMFQEYIEYNNIRGNMQRIVMACGGEENSRMIASKVVQPIANKHYEALEQQKRLKISNDEIEALLLAEGWGTQAGSPTGELLLSAPAQSLEELNIIEADYIILDDEEAASLPF